MNTGMEVDTWIFQVTGGSVCTRMRTLSESNRSWLLCIVFFVLYCVLYCVLRYLRV